jgi:hypothetical protein
LAVDRERKGKSKTILREVARKLFGETDFAKYILAALKSRWFDAGRD